MVTLIPIEQEGEPRIPEADSDLIRDVVAGTLKLYVTRGYEPPWIGYFAVRSGECVGTCAFKSPPGNGRVEIAYFTFPPHERQGIARDMARELVRIAREADETLIVTAQTLPEESPSTRILSRLRFEMTGTVPHPDDGPVWNWELRPGRGDSL